MPDTTKPLWILLAAALALSACGSPPEGKEDQNVESNWELLDDPGGAGPDGQPSGSVTAESCWETLPPSDTGPAEKTENGSKEETIEMNVILGGVPVLVEWEDNDAVRGLRDMVSRGTLKIELSGFGGFEQVGSLGARLPRDDVEITAAPGDILLYSGNKIVVFYGCNTWAYTRMGRIIGMSEEELADLLGNGSVILEISAG